jgi:hypothetical protein
MADANSAVPGRYDLVSSLYGPGTTACWYLTSMSCLVSWMLHPKKRKSGSLDSDFIAVLTFPAVAAGHLISQLHEYPSDKAVLLTTNDPNMLKRIAAIEAPLNITENFMTLFVLMFIVAVYFRCVKRAVCLAFVGAVSFTAESYLFFTTWSAGVSQQNINLSRPFLFNFAAIFFVSLVVLVILVLLVLGLLVIFYFKQSFRTTLMTSTPDEGEALRIYRQENQDPYEDICLRAISKLTHILLPNCLFSVAFPLIHDRLATHSASLSTFIHSSASRLFRDLYPRTNVSVTDLDQAVAILAGATILGFGLYGIANAQYEKWLENLKAEEE